MSISGRAALSRQVRAFFQMQLCGVVSKDAIKLADAEVNERLPNGFRHPDGKLKETLEVTFGNMHMLVLSPRVADPKGNLIDPQGTLVVSAAGREYRGNTISPSSWAGAAQFIRENYDATS